MSKLIFYKETAKHKIGDIIDGYVDTEGNVFIYDPRYDNIKDPSYRQFMSSYFAIKYPPEYPVMNLAEWRDKQIDSILEDD